MKWLISITSILLVITITIGGGLCKQYDSKKIRKWVVFLSSVLFIVILILLKNY